MTQEGQRIVKLLKDIEVSSRRIIEVLRDEDKDSFTRIDNLDSQDIVARRLTIIGEAAAALLKKHEKFCLDNPQIPLREAKGMRNILVHDYDGVDWDTVWNTAQLALPKLIKSIEPLLSHEER